MRVLKYIGLFVAVAVVTGAVTLGALVWGPAFLDEPAAAADSVVVWPEAVAERTVPKPPPTVERITLLAVGDLMMHTPQLSSARTTDGYDFTPCFAPVAPRISAADLAIGNFETVLAGADRGYTGYPTFNSPDSYAEAAVEAFLKAFPECWEGRVNTAVV